MAIDVTIKPALPIKGSTTIYKLLTTYPDGRASRLMTKLGWECTYCSARKHEPLSLAAKRHGNPVKPVLECFRSLDKGGPSNELILQARTRKKIAGINWQKYTKKNT